MATTDGGTNETYAKKVIQVITRDMPCFFYLPGTCLEHQSHLGVLGSLKHVDNMLREHGCAWRYFSSMAMITNTLRDLSQLLFFLLASPLW